eukprot:Phypoly_transcript_16044.p1 GENE.Phypoly_transcript_16044~~Phypoly_transcript_16044.p1  ORF type:complete len:220 (+),score=38.84 Phypoly_transcript_16044:182-841(+)
MNLSTWFFVVVLVLIGITFLVEVVKPKLDIHARNKQFKNRDHSEHDKKRQKLLLEKQEEFTQETREKIEQQQQIKAQHALERDEKYLTNPKKYMNARTIKESDAEIIQRKKTEEKNRKKERAQQLRDNLPPEPISTPENVAQITSIQIKLPNKGKPLYRKFVATDTIQHIVDYLDSTELIDKEYTLVIPYPKKMLQDLSMTMIEACLHPNATLIVQEQN